MVQVKDTIKLDLILFWIFILTLIRNLLTPPCVGSCKLLIYQCCQCWLVNIASLQSKLWSPQSSNLCNCANLYFDLSCPSLLIWVVRIWDVWIWVVRIWDVRFELSSLSCPVMSCPVTDLFSITGKGLGSQARALFGDAAPRRLSLIGRNFEPPDVIKNAVYYVHAPLILSDTQ